MGFLYPCLLGEAFGEDTALPAVWYLPEGCTNGFTEWILIQNPSSGTASVRITFMKSDGTTVIKNITVSPTSRYSVKVNDVVPDESLSAKVESMNGIGIAVERAMYWDSDDMEGVDGTCSAGINEPNDTWYFAEGCTDGFDEWILVQNPNNSTASVRATFMKSDGTTVVKNINVMATSRYTIHVNDVIPNKDVSVKLESINGVTVLAERTMYWDKEWIHWAGGHSSIGISEPDTVWYFAEGSTDGFDEWILIQNPNSNTAQCTMTFMKSNGSTVTKNITVLPTSRYSFKVNDFLPNFALSVKVESTNGVGVIAERAMYWDPGLNAHENTYIAFGDSVTAGYGAGEGYPSRLERKLDTITSSTVYNEGVPGEWTSGGLARIESVLKNYRAKYILIMEGINDINSGHSADVVISHLRAMIKKAKIYGTIPILSSMIYIGGSLEDKVANEVNPAIEALAAEYNIPFVDQYSALSQYGSSDMTDNFHPNDAGQEVMAVVWFNKIRELENSRFSLGNRFGGHASSGVNAPATTWYLAEGATLDTFEEWVLIQNPNSVFSSCKVTFMKSNGSTVVKNITVNPTSRYTICVNDYVPNYSVSTKVESTNSVGIIVERAMYWDVDEMPWGGGHCSNGVVEGAVTESPLAESPLSEPSPGR